MLIRDLNIIPAKDKRKLGKYAAMTVEEYISDITAQIERGVNVNLFYRKLMETLRDNEAVWKNSDDVDEEEDKEESDLVFLVLKEVPIDFIHYYVDSKEYEKTINLLEYEDVTDLYKLHVYNPPGYLKHVFVEVTRKWKKLIAKEHERIYAEWVDFSSDHIIPSSYDKRLGLVENIKNAFVEYAMLLSQRSTDKFYCGTPGNPEIMRKYSTILLESYKNGLSYQEIADKHPFGTSENIRKIKEEIWGNLKSGVRQIRNVVLHPDIIELLKTLNSECLYHSVEKFKSYTCSKDVEYLNLFDFEVLDISDDQFIVPKEKKGLYRKVSKCVTDVLTRAVLPKEIEELVELVRKEPKLQAVDYSDDFVRNVLGCSSFVDVLDDGRVQIKDAYLTNVKMRFVRIIYNAKENITAEEAKKRYGEIYGEIPSDGPSQSNEHRIYCDSRKWWYYGTPRIPVDDIIVEFIDRHKIFYFSVLENLLKKTGYTVTESIRTKVTNLCYVDNEDASHLCGKLFVDEFPQFSWRNENREALSNWILNRIKDYMSGKNEVFLNDVIDYVREQAEGTDYERDIIPRVKSTIDTFSGEGNPFIKSGKMLSKNREVYDSTDFNILGLRGTKYPFFLQIRSIILNAIKKTEDGRLLLSDAIRIVNENIAEPQERHTVKSALTNKHLPPINVELKKADGKMYIVRIGQDMKPEPVYEVRQSDDTGEKEVAREIHEIWERPAISYRLSVDWNGLAPALKRELSFYRRWMEHDNIDYDGAVEYFVQFIRKSQNSNLNQKLPRNLYEYCFAKTDFYDRNMYLSNLTLFYEALLSEIIYQNSGVHMHKAGLYERALEFPFLKNALALSSRETKGFERIFNDLYFKRNKIAHGEPVELSSADTARTISDFIALYVFTLAKYHLN